MRQLAGLGGLVVRDSGATRGAVTIRILAETLEAATHALAGTAGTRLADMFADNDGDAPTLRLVWAHDTGQAGYLVTETDDRAAISTRRCPTSLPPRSSRNARSTSSSASGPRPASR